MARVKVQITTPSNNVIKVSPGVSALSSVQLYLNELIDVNSAHGAEGYVLTQQADGTFAMEAVATTLSDLSDTNILNPQGGDSLVYDAGSQKWVPGGVKSVNGQDGDVVITIPSPPPTPGVSGLADTNITSLQDDQIIRYDSFSGEWLNEDLEALPAGGTTGQALVKATGTDYDVEWADIAIDTQYHNRFQTDAETFRSGATATTELYYTAKADGDGLAESASSDTPTAGKIIRRKIYYSEAAFADPDTGTWVEFTPAPADDASFATVKAALLEYLKARTGGTVPISLKQTWEEVTAAPTFTGLLNESYGSGAAAAYGTRRLNGSYSGACMTIRRASDGTTQTIGFVGEEIDESAITTFCTGTTCTVQVWHDQSQTGGTGSGNDAEQTTPANQPTIYTGGQLVKEGGRLALEFDVTDRLTNNMSVINQPITVFNTVTVENYGSVNYAFDSGYTTGDRVFIGMNTSNNWRYFAGSTVNSSTTVAFKQTVLTGLFNGGSSELFLDGLSISTGNAGSNGLSDLVIGNKNDGTNFSIYGNVQEIVIYNSDQDAAGNRTDIEGNISAYYQSAKLLDEQYGSGAEAAYSVRQLKRDNTECMVIRRASDSTTTTIGFDSEGNIDEAAIESFCTGTTCTVYQWLDQSGNGNTATAPSTGEEPTIYTGGALVKVNGKVALDTNDDHLLFNSTISFDNDFTQFLVTKKDNTNNSGSEILHHGTAGTAVYAEGFAGGGLPVLKNIVGSQYVIHSSLNNDFAMTTADQQKLIFANRRGTTGASALDGSAEKTATASFTGTVSYESILGNTGGGSHSYDGFAQEAIFYADDKSSVRTSIEENIGDYFTQNTPLLDTYSGAAAAYSLRLLDSTYTGALVEVYNGSSYADIGANVFGELDTVALAAHCGSNDGFVSKWYDQAGSNDAVQTNTANMPKIYDGTTGVVTENEKPAIKTDGVDDVLESSVDCGSNFQFALIGATKNSGRGYFSNLASTNDGVEILNFGNSYRFSIEGDDDILGVTTNSQTLAMLSYDGTNKIYSVDATENVDALSKTVAVSAGSEFGKRIGSEPVVAVYQEFVLWNTSTHIISRADIKTNVNTFYSIY